MVRARLKYNFDFSAVTEHKIQAIQRTGEQCREGVGDGLRQTGCKIGEKTLEGEHYL
jgi:hypothetical protein